MSTPVASLTVALGWGAYELARQTGAGADLAYAWVSGKATIPPALLAWLEHRASTAIPAPVWRRPRKRRADSGTTRATPAPARQVP